jgi:3-hydroxyacyl-CoA dehydrogenase
MSEWKPRPNAYDSPVCIIGAGVLGRRLATMWASRGGVVHIVDQIASVREDAVKYFNETDRPVQVNLS